MSHAIFSQLTRHLKYLIDLSFNGKAFFCPSLPLKDYPRVIRRKLIHSFNKKELNDYLFLLSF